MALTVEDRRKFCEQAIVNKEGRRFSLKGRDWVIREFWGPAHSWRIVANEVENLCEVCTEHVWKFTSWHHDWKEFYSCKNCAGCHLVPILVLALNLSRREGKTFNAAAYTISEICLKKNRNILFLATSGDQNKMLFEDNWETPIKSSPILRKMCTIVGERITVKRTGSQFRYAKTSAANSVAGGGVSVLILDECRGLSPKAALSAIGSTRDQGGKSCPAGHTDFPNTDDSPERCPACNAWLEPWFPLVILTSSSGIETGTELDWFQNLVDSQLGSLDGGYPVANVHTFRMEESENPVVQEAVTDAYTAFFSQSEATRPYVAVEMHNQTMRIGTDFVSLTAIKAATDRRVVQHTTSNERCVAFLDTSTTGDLTSLVILCEDSNRTMESFGSVYVARVDRWDPKKQRNGVIDPAEVEAHILKLLPNFPNMVAMGVDVRGSVGWAHTLVESLTKQGFRFVQAFGSRGSQDRPERDLGWSLFEQRLLTRKMLLPDDAGIRKELQGVHKKVRTDGSYQIVDRNRNQCHADVTEGIASACLIIHREQSKPKPQSLAAMNRRPKTKSRGLSKYLGTGLGESDIL